MALLFGRYEYVRELGAGTTGRVMLVRDRAEPGRERAIKVVPARDATWLTWEFSRLSAFVHPRLARVYELLALKEPLHELGLAEGSVLLVEEYVAGVPWSRFAERMRHDRAALERALHATACGVAEALCAVHDAGLVHGDVKPENVLIEEATGEARLIDFGFARPPAANAPPRGTPRMMAPELYAGVLGYGADVYALGASLYDLLGGSSRSFGPLRTFAPLPGVSRPWMDLVQALCASDPRARPADGREALSLLFVMGKKAGYEHARSTRYALASPARTPDTLARRARALPYAPHGELVQRLADALSAHPFVLLRGPVGTGRTRLLREALRVENERRLAREGKASTYVESVAAAEAVATEELLLVLDPASEAELAEAARAVAAFRLTGRTLRVVGVVEPHVEHAGAQAVDMHPMVEQELGALVASALDRRSVEPGVVANVLRASGGWPGRACALIASALVEGHDLREARVPSASDERAHLMGLSANALRLLEAVAWLPPLLTRPRAAARLFAHPSEAERAFSELATQVFVRSAEGTSELSPTLARALRTRSRSRARDAFSELANHADFRGQGGAFADWLRNDEEASRKAFLSEARRLRAQRNARAARALLEEAVELVGGSEVKRELAELLRAQANYAEALAVLAAEHDEPSALLRAELLRLIGERQKALALLVNTRFSEAVFRARASALKARLSFDAGDLERAEGFARTCVEAADSEAQVRGREVCVLVALARGAQAESEAERLVEAAETLVDARFLARALSLRGQVFAATGQRGRALGDARRALELARTAGESFEAATFALNLGLLEFEAGELGRALDALDEAAYRLCMAARPQQLARVLFNLGNVALFVGDYDRAEVVLGEALVHVEAHPDAWAVALTRMASAELRLVRGDLDQAVRLLEAALSEVSSEHMSLRALLLARLSQLHTSQDELTVAAERLAEAEKLANDADVRAGPEVAIAAMRWLVARGAHAEAEARARTALATFGERAPVPERVRLLLASIDAARAAGYELEASQRSFACRALLEQVLSGLSPRLRAAMRALPAHARVFEGSVRERPAGGTFNSVERFRTLLRRARLLFAESSRSRLLARAAELMLELVHAERALVITARARVPAGLRVAAHAELVTHGHSGNAPRNTAVPFSRSVVERALLEKEPVVTLDAGSDARFDAVQSLHALSVRSVLCVPMPGLDEPAALYLDDRMRRGAFSSEDVALVEDLALLLAQALRTLALRRAQERRAERAEKAHEQLAGEFARVAKGEASSRGDLVFTSAVMRRVVELAERVAVSEVPLLIRGESGTGKELIARHVHAVSLRCAAPFVAENCAALPETLLESALFGHVRGAFTGADRARKGLFELADGGTLFLDEVGEMTPALQAKLLRVLQEGELRPLGSERTRKVDVRLICATHRDLEQLVREGKFREDLYYRMAVVTIDVPPLRERREDIAILVQHFVQKHGTGRAVSISAEVLRALEEAPWPGNVRELENHVRRALALSDDRIELSHIALPAPRRELPSELDLHAQTELLTRTLVEQALARAGGNLTHAAELLGISRFGLQKMVKRFGLGPYLGRHRK